MSEPLPMVRVMWTDAQNDAPTWCRIEELTSEPCIATTVGSLLPTVRRNHISVALSWYPDEDGAPLVGDVMHIPQAMIVSVQHLGPES